MSVAIVVAVVFAVFCGGNQWAMSRATRPARPAGLHCQMAARCHRRVTRGVIRPGWIRPAMSCTKHAR